MTKYINIHRDDTQVRSDPYECEIVILHEDEEYKLLEWFMV